jgi:hypothetical protein
MYPISDIFFQNIQVPLYWIAPGIGNWTTQFDLSNEVDWQMDHDIKK